MQNRARLDSALWIFPSGFAAELARHYVNNTRLPGWPHLDKTQDSGYIKRTLCACWWQKSDGCPWTSIWWFSWVLWALLRPRKYKVYSLGWKFKDFQHILSIIWCGKQRLIYIILWEVKNLEHKLVSVTYRFSLEKLKKQPLILIMDSTIKGKVTAWVQIILNVLILWINCLHVIDISLILHIHIQKGVKLFCLTSLDVNEKPRWTF